MSNKVYVDVLAEFSKDGLLIPKEITWEDGRKYEITRVKDKRRAASTRAGGVGERYTCVVDGKEIFLFYEDNNMATADIYDLMDELSLAFRSSSATGRSCL